MYIYNRMYSDAEDSDDDYPKAKATKKAYGDVDDADGSDEESNASFEEQEQDGDEDFEDPNAEDMMDDADADAEDDHEDEEEEEEEEVEEEEDDEDDENESSAISKRKSSPSKKMSAPISFDYDDEEEEYEENYLQKFDHELNKNYIHEYHPECLNHNSDEIQKLCVVVRDENNIIIDPLHKTLPYLTKYEKARVLGQRAKQIEVGAKPFIRVPEHIIEAHIIAELELKEKKIPFIIKRPIPGGKFEYWHLKDLEMIHF